MRSFAGERERETEKETQSVRERGRECERKGGAEGATGIVCTRSVCATQDYSCILAFWRLYGSKRLAQ